MFLVPMGEQDDSRPKAYKSANVDDDFIDVTSDDDDEEIIPADLNLYKRITKQWLMFQEVGGFVVLTSVVSFLFVIFRSASYFPLVVGLFGLVILFVTTIFAFSWSQLRTLDKIRYFFGAVGIGFAAAISGHDIMTDWVIKNQQLTAGIIAGVVSIGLFFALKAANNYFASKRRRY